MTLLELNPGGGTTLPGPVSKIVCQSGQIIVVDPTTKPATTTTLNSDDVWDGGPDKGGIGIIDVDGSRIYYENGNAPVGNRTDSQLVVPPDAQAEHDPRGDAPDPTPQGAIDPRGLVPERSDEELNKLPAGNSEDSDAPVPTTVVPNAPQRGDTDSDSPTGGTGPYEDRTVKELKATAEKNGTDLEGATTKADIIAKLRGE